MQRYVRILSQYMLGGLWTYHICVMILIFSQKGYIPSHKESATCCTVPGTEWESVFLLQEQTVLNIYFIITMFTLTF